jgi:hypothetical protein
VNGDGIADLVLGAWGADPGGLAGALRLNTGMTLAGLALGAIPIASAAPFPAVFPLASLLTGAGSGFPVTFRQRIRAYTDGLRGIHLSWRYY